MNDGAWYAKPLDDYDSSDWMAAKKYMNKNSYDRLRRIAKKAGLLKDPGAFSLSMNSQGETGIFGRSRDKDAQAEFNEAIQSWTASVISQLKSSISSMVKNDRNLSKSLKASYQYKYGEMISIGFSFAREGAWIHHGAGKGYGGFGSNSRWYDKYGNKMTMHADSYGKMGTGNRKAIEWFNPVLERNLDALADIIADYDSSIVLDASNIFIN